MSAADTDRALGDRLREARRIIGRADGSGSPAHRLEVASVTVALLVIVVFPVVRAVTVTLAPVLDGLSWQVVLRDAGVVAVAILVVAAVLPEAVGPAQSTLPELTFLVRGPFGVITVLHGRTRIRIAATAATVGVLAAVPPIAAHADGVVTAAAVVGGLGVGATAGRMQLRRQGPRARPRPCAVVSVVVLVLVGASAATVLVLVLVGTAAPLNTVEASTAPGATPAQLVSAVVVIVLGLGVTTWALRSVDAALARVSPAALERASEQRSTAVAGLAVGDASVVIPPTPPGRLRRRLPPVRFADSLVRRTVQRDLRGMRRLGVRIPVALLAIGGAAAVMAAAPTQAVVLVVMGVVQQVAVGPLLAGLRAHVEHATLDVFERGAPWRRHLAHLLAPVASVVGAATVGATVGALVDVGPGAVSLVGAVFTPVLVALTAIASRAWLFHGTGAPLWVRTPVPTALGDVSGLVFLAWTARGVVPMLVVGAVCTGRGAVLGALAGLVIAVALAALAAGRDALAARGRFATGGTSE